MTAADTSIAAKTHVSLHVRDVARSVAFTEALYGVAAEVQAARERLIAAGLASVDEGDTVCCYARQDKVWAHDPDGLPWEYYTVLEHVETP